jgi:CBS domain containing-hemolysin-like protein
MLPKNGEKLKVQDLTIKVTDTDNRRIKSFEIRKA